MIYHSMNLDCCRGPTRKFISIWMVIWGVLFSVIPLCACAKNRQVEIVALNFSRLIENVGPTVVNIQAIVTDSNEPLAYPEDDGSGEKGMMEDFLQRFFGDDEEDKEMILPNVGSGFIIDDQGYIVTNNHVVENADQITVLLQNEKEYVAEVIGSDSNTDLALLKINADMVLPHATLGNSDQMKVGQWVVAIGSPFGLSHTVTAGIVSAKGRVIGSSLYDDFIQTDASINPGNSGGPLINMNGEVIGINSAIVAGGSGIGFAIPINLAKGIIKQLKSKGEVVRGWIGVNIQDLDSELAEYYGIVGTAGVLVVDVFDGDPAEKSGIRAKDIILSIENRGITNSRDLKKTIAGFEVGRKIKIEILRKGHKETVHLKVAKRDENKKLARNQVRENADGLGLYLSDLSQEIIERFDLQSKLGVVVVSIDSGSKADISGLKVGDIILEINHKSIDNIDVYQEEFKRSKIAKPKYFDMLINRVNVGLMVVRIKK